MSGMMVSIKKHRQRRSAVRFVTSVIEKGDVNVSYNSGQVQLIAGGDDSEERYDLYAAKGDFFTGAPKTFHDIAVISLVKEEGPFFTYYSLKFNHTDLELSERKAHWLFDRVNALKMQQQNNATVQAM